MPLSSLSLFLYLDLGVEISAKDHIPVLSGPSCRISNQSLTFLKVYRIDLADAPVASEQVFKLVDGWSRR